VCRTMYLELFRAVGLFPAVLAPVEVLVVTTVPDQSDPAAESSRANRTDVRPDNERYLHKNKADQHRYRAGTVTADR
jgi:hypothetical protein